MPSSLTSLLRKESIVAPPGFNRWLVPPVSIAIHLCIGSVYAWSVFNNPLTREIGVVAPAADDWSLGQVTWIFSVAIVFLGLSAAVAGRWLEEVGPRMVGVVAGLLWGGGFLVGSAGIHWHQLWLVYLGYGVLGGCGLGLGYVSPVSTLIRWFPDRRGMATGMAIMGFGGGAILAAPVKEGLLQHFFQPPQFLGAAESVELQTDSEGRRYVMLDGERKDVVVASQREIKATGRNDLAEGVYVAGTGNSGTGGTFRVLGVSYLVVIVLAAFCYRVPAPGWKPQGWVPPEVTDPKHKRMTAGNVSLSRAVRTPAFYLLWIMLCFNVTAGIGVLGVAKDMMKDIFGTTLPAVVDVSFAATYVMMISVFNMLGRFLWASASDYIGRRATYGIFFVLGFLLYASIPWTARQMSVSPSVTWLVVFYAVTMVIFTMYGGGFATIPAYLADVFGTAHVGSIHGRLLTAWSTAGVLGPLAITKLREISVSNGLERLVAGVDPARFLSTFGAPVEKWQELAASKSLTISKLMEIMPGGTVDPTPGLYNTTMYAMAALLLVALVANFFVHPVEPDEASA
jgi:MFS family permease